jgi:hypothetical protein
MTGWLRPHNQQGYSCMRSHALPCKTRKKGAWGTVGKVLAWALPFIVSIAAWLTSQHATDIANRAMQIQKAMSLLSVEPILEVGAIFPGHILLYNRGKVDAFAVTVEMVVLEVGNPPSGVPFKSWQTQIPKWSPGNIAPSQERSIPVSAPHTQPVGDLPEEILKSRQRYIELKIGYLHPTNRKRYDLKAVYFVGTTGQWVSATGLYADTAFTRKIKQSIKDEGFLSRPWVPEYDQVYVKSE